MPGGGFLILGSPVSRPRVLRLTAETAHGIMDVTQKITGEGEHMETISFDLTKRLGAFKPLNAVNGGP